MFLPSLQHSRHMLQSHCRRWSEE